MRMKVKLSILVVAFFMGPTYAADSEYEESVKDLMEVEEQIREYQKLNEQQKDAIASLEKKVQCTYDMVKKYESCEEQFDKKSNNYFICIDNAKQEKDPPLNLLQRQWEILVPWRNGVS